MGIQKSGPFGGFSGKTGPIIGRQCKGKNVITALHHKSTKPDTEEQLVVQDRFAMLNNFLLSIKELVQPGFKKFARHNSPVNAAFRYNYPHAFVLVNGMYQLNYPSLVYSRGHVSAPLSVSLQLNGDSIVLSWAKQEESMYCRDSDLATVLVYNADTHRVTTAVQAINRSQLGCVLQLPIGSAGDHLHCYMSFSSADGKLAGDSRYINLALI